MFCFVGSKGKKNAGWNSNTCQSEKIKIISEINYKFDNHTSGRKKVFTDGYFSKLFFNL